MIKIRKFVFAAIYYTAAALGAWIVIIAPVGVTIGLVASLLIVALTFYITRGVAHGPK